MGNQPSSGEGRTSGGGSLTDSARPPLRNFLRSQGTLGLSKAELDQRCQPSGLYQRCDWDDKAIRRLIGDGKLASRQKGTEERVGTGDQECPICFLNYRQVNVTKCCQAAICTECYLQVRPQKDKSSSCPFCNCNRLAVTVGKNLDESAIKQREEEEQTIIEAQIRANIAASQDVSINSSQHTPESATETSFGSNLEKHDRVATMRARSSSMSSDQSGEPFRMGNYSAIAMTADERRQLEAEMRAQKSHPLALRLEQEEAERRLENQRDYQLNQSGPLVRNHIPRNDRDWNQIVEAFVSSGNGSVRSLDDLVVSEAANMLSREEARRRERGAGEVNDGNLDAAQDYRERLPLALARIARQRGGDGGSANAGIDELSTYMDSLMQAMGTEARNGSSNLESAFLMMRGLSEEDQIAMAIAASLEEPQNESSAEDSSVGDAVTPSDARTASS